MTHMIKLPVHACRLKTLILNDNKLICISLHQAKEEVTPKHQEHHRGEMTFPCMDDHVLCMCT